MKEKINHTVEKTNHIMKKINYILKKLFFPARLLQQQVLVSSHFYTGGSRMGEAICIPAAPGCAENPSKVGHKSKPTTMWLGTPLSKELAEGELVRFGGSFKGEGDQRGGESMHGCVCDRGRPACDECCDGSRSDVSWDRTRSGLGKLSEEMCGLRAPSAPNLYGQYGQAAAASGAKLWARTFFGSSGIVEC